MQEGLDASHVLFTALSNRLANQHKKQQDTTMNGQFLEEIKTAIVSAFMNAPQVDGRNARVPVDLAIPSKSRQARVFENQSGTYWASIPQVPITST